MPEESGKATSREELARYLKQQVELGNDVVRYRTPISGRTMKKDTASAKLASGMPAAHLDKAVGKTSGSVADRMAALEKEISVCTKCPLHETRQSTVPGTGPSDANLVFVGEGPGAEEDKQGKPFVGRAGQLLTKIIAAVDFKREEVFITNIVKCRPPQNRDPEPGEIAACEPYLKRQLELLQPRVICTLGRHAAMTLLQKKDSMAGLRTGEHHYEGIRLFPTYHPAALLRNSQWKRPVWEDIQNVRKYHDDAKRNS